MSRPLHGGLCWVDYQLESASIGEGWRWNLPYACYAKTRSNHINIFLECGVALCMCKCGLYVIGGLVFCLSNIMT